MNAKKAKKMRQLLRQIPSVTSIGAAYDKPTVIVKDGQRHHDGGMTLKDNCPRGIYQNMKKHAGKNRGRVTDMTMTHDQQSDEPTLIITLGDAVHAMIND